MNYQLLYLVRFVLNNAERRGAWKLLTETVADSGLFIKVCLVIQVR